MKRASGDRTVEADLLVAEQIARLFQRRPGVVWELITAPYHSRAEDVEIRDRAGVLVAYARRAAA